jgi:hypothetical protein
MAENERRASDQPLATGSDHVHRDRIDHTTHNTAQVPLGSVVARIAAATPDVAYERSTASRPRRGTSTDG